MLYSAPLRPALSGFVLVVCTRVGGCLEPNPRAARPRAARARSGHSPASGEIQEKVRSRHQPGQRADDACRGQDASPWYPDLVLQTADKNRKLAGVVEVETAESVNHLEAMSQWAAFAAPAGAVSPLSADRLDRQRPPLLHRHGDSGGGAVGLSVGRRSDSVHAGAALCQATPSKASAAAASEACSRVRAPPSRRRLRTPGGTRASPAAARDLERARLAPRTNGRPPRRRRGSPARRGCTRRAPGGQAESRRPRAVRRAKVAATRKSKSAASSRAPRSAGKPPVPFLRVMRDKRGYETTYLMHWFREGTRQRSRVLYVFRTPGGVRVGRLPLDRDVLRQIEAQHPESQFDWNAVRENQQIIEPAPDFRRRRPRREERRGRPARSAPPSRQSSRLRPPARAPARQRRRGCSAVGIEGRQPGRADRLSARMVSADPRANRAAHRGSRAADALLALAERLNPASWTDADQITSGSAAGGGSARAAVARVGQTAAPGARSADRRPPDCCDEASNPAAEPRATARVPDDSSES